MRCRILVCALALMAALPSHAARAQQGSAGEPILRVAIDPPSVVVGQQTTLRIDDEIFRAAKAEAARVGVTLTSFIETALLDRLHHLGDHQTSRKSPGASSLEREIRERDELMEALLQRTAHFRVGPKPTRAEMNER